MNRASKNEPKPEGLAQVVIPEKKKKKKEPSSSHNNGIMQKSTIKHSMVSINTFTYFKLTSYRFLSN